METLRNGDIEI
jgi:hypothetical protein